jgi:hypothetical protein
MTYNLNSKIDASDYNNLIGTGTVTGVTAGDGRIVPAASFANVINTIYGQGFGNAGYGQTALTSVTALSKITATQWSSLLGAYNIILSHQTGTGANIALPTAGTKILYLSALQNGINTAYTNRAVSSIAGATVVQTGTTNTGNVGAGGAGFAVSYTRTIAWPSDEAARYFFNAGGSLGFDFSSTTTATGATSTLRSADIVTLIATRVAGITTFAANFNSNRAGTGSLTSLTSFPLRGYYDLTNSNVTLFTANTNTASYATDRFSVFVRSSSPNGGAGAGGNGGTISVVMLVQGSTRAGTFNTWANLRLSNSITVRYPESTYLANTWGAVTVT